MSDNITADKEIVKYWNDSSKGYKKGVEKELSNGGRDVWIDVVLRNAPKKKKLKILDVGTGPGFFTIKFGKLGHDIVGIDVSEGMLKAARENAKAQGVKARFLKMDADRLYFENETFDMVICRNVTWTLPNPFECYREWKRVLKAGGKLVFFDGNWYINQFEKELNEIVNDDIRERLTVGGLDHLDMHSDFHVRDSLWENLPLIGADRPEWDKRMLHKLRFANIRTVEGFLKDSEEKDAHGVARVSPEFFVTAEKLSQIDEDEMVLKEYWDGISPCLSAALWRLAKAEKSDGYAKSISKMIPKKCKILDVGSGCGAASIGLAKTGFEVTALDSSKQMLRELKRCCDEQKAFVEPVEGDAESMPFKKETFDCVVIRNTLWCSEHPEKILKESARVLRKGGTLIVTDGEWIANLDNSISENTCKMPPGALRDAGYGIADTIAEAMERLPLTGISRPEWDSKAIAGAGLSVKSVEDFDDPLMLTNEKNTVGRGFVVIAKKV